MSSYIDIAPGAFKIFSRKKLRENSKHNKRKSRTSNKHILYWPYIERKLSSDEPDSSFDTMLGADCFFDTDQRPTPNAMGYVM